jgi:hypothetical protein
MLEAASTSETSLLITLMMAAASTSETLVNFRQTTRRCNPEDSQLHAAFYLTRIMITILYQSMTLFIEV